MFGNRRNNFNFDDLMARYEKMMKEFNNLDWKKESDYESPDGSYKYTSYVKVFDLSDIFDGNKSKEMGKAEYLNIKLERAIEMEDFEEAVKLRDQIKNLETNQEEIQKLELELKESIKEQNFEKSIEIRDQLRKLRS
jgi:excinuclease UvrABC helicase subunit UvrB